MFKPEELMSILSPYQIRQIKVHSKEAVESLPEDHPWIHYLGSLDILCDTALTLWDNSSQMLEEDVEWT